MTRAVEEILGLIYSVDEHIDFGRFDKAGALFEEASVLVEDTAVALLGSQDVTAYLHMTLRRYGDGTCLTVRSTVNAMVQADEQTGQATSRAYFTVVQATPDLPLQLILGGHYHDEFRYTDGGWAFASRLVRVRLRGDLTRHVLTATDR